MKDWKKLLENRTVRIVLFCALALLLLAAIWRVFFAGESAVGGYDETEKEARISAMLERVDGIEKRRASPPCWSGSTVSRMLP